MSTLVVRNKLAKAVEKLALDELSGKIAATSVLLNRYPLRAGTGG
jgi:arginine/lysine/ornithine decarboxylase